jgi:hypothetical protein
MDWVNIASSIKTPLIAGNTFAGQSAAKLVNLQEGSTTSRKTYTQVSGNGAHSKE